MSSSNDASNHAHLFHFSGANKAGMGEMDKKLQSDVIYEISKNSSFFKHAKIQDIKTDEKIVIIKKKICDLKNNSNLLCHLQGKVKNDIADLELKRNLRRICCVMDMDMFYAAVEIRDKPELIDKPVAVGGDSMICTSNYIARKFGVRSAMPG